MIDLNKRELLEIEGGAISGTLLSSIIKGISSIFDLGKTLGSSIRRILSKNICQL